MLGERKRRFERLLALRAREVEQKLVSLARTQDQMRTTRLALEAAQAELRRAAQAYRVPHGGSKTAEEFASTGEWLRSRVNHVEQALSNQDKSKQRVALAQKELVRAEKAKRQIEVLLERLAAEQLQQQNRQEQVEQDEMAAVFAARRT